MSMPRPIELAVLGGGSWGTTLAHLGAVAGGRVRLWMRNGDTLREIRPADLLGETVVHGARKSPGRRTDRPKRQRHDGAAGCRKAKSKPGAGTHRARWLAAQVLEPLLQRHRTRREQHQQMRSPGGGLEQDGHHPRLRVRIWL